MEAHHLIPMSQHDNFVDYAEYYTNLVLMNVEANYRIGGDVDVDLVCREFVHVESLFYPQLENSYKEILDERRNLKGKEDFHCYHRPLK